MSAGDCSHVIDVLRQYPLGDLKAVLPVSAREVGIEIRPASIGPLADYLRQRFDARPELILAEDTRSTAGGFTLRYVFELPGRDVFVRVSAVLDPGRKDFRSLATRWFPASLFEREIQDMFGLMPQDHPDLRRLPLHQFWPENYQPLLKDSAVSENFKDDGQAFPFQQVSGEGIYQITVGPVHAGIIEPGHFRFSVDGETIVNLESRLYFLHKGIEKLFESMSLVRGVELAERISGDSSVAHALAFCMAAEQCAGVDVPPRGRYLRVLLQELERLYNHIADVGAICTDTGFAVANTHAMRLREDVLRLNESLAGHRLLRGVIVPGGVRLDELPDDAVRNAVQSVRRIAADFSEVVAMALDSALVLDRLHATGVLANQTARDLQVCGIAARASGIDADTRRDHPYAAYEELKFKVPVFQEGDVWARMMVRVEEVRESAGLIEQVLEGLPAGPAGDPVGALRPDTQAFAVVEGWRGPIWHWMSAGAAGEIVRVKVKDPSFSNWPALNHAILGNIVPDFPLCNKSFNLSYAGNDL